MNTSTNIRVMDMVGSILIISSNSFMNICGRTDTAPSTWKVIMNINNHVSVSTLATDDASCYLTTACGCVYTLVMVSNTLIRWRAVNDDWVLTNRGLPRQKGSCWIMKHTHVRYPIIYRGYVRSV
jgi:hypothetical protein